MITVNTSPLYTVMLRVFRRTNKQQEGSQLKLRVADPRAAQVWVKEINAQQLRAFSDSPDEPPSSAWRRRKRSSDPTVVMIEPISLSVMEGRTATGKSGVIMASSQVIVVDKTADNP